MNALEKSIDTRSKKTSDKITQSIIELKVYNHPGVMSHICGLLARRAYNMEAIMCTPMQDKQFSCIWLVLNEEQRLPQVIQQVNKLHDVIKVQQHVAEPCELNALAAVWPSTMEN